MMPGATLQAVCHSGRCARQATAAVIIPARNEQTSITACLAAFARQPADSLAQCVIIVVANNCTDATVTSALRAASRHSLPATVLEVAVPAQAGVGLARKIGTQMATELAPAVKYVLTTDADSTVTQNWLPANLARLQTVDVVCGSVQPAPAGLARLPAKLRAAQAQACAYRAACVHFAQLINASGVQLGRFGAARGASLAFRARALHACGGFSSMPCYEDRDVVARAERAGLRIEHADEVVVHGACRLKPCAPAGATSMLVERLRQLDAFADDALPPVDTLLGRALAHHQGTSVSPALYCHRPPRLRVAELASETHRLHHINALLGPLERAQRLPHLQHWVQGLTLGTGTPAASAMAGPVLLGGNCAVGL